MKYILWPIAMILCLVLCLVFLLGVSYLIEITGFVDPIETIEMEGDLW